MPKAQVTKAETDKWDFKSDCIRSQLTERPNQECGGKKSSTIYLVRDYPLNT